MNSKMQFKAEKVTMGDLIGVITDAVLEVAQDEDMATRSPALCSCDSWRSQIRKRPIICSLTAPARFTKCSHPAPLSDEEKVSGAKVD